MKFIMASAGVGVQELLVVVIGIAVCVGVFLALRALLLWYWKIDKIVDNQQAQVQLLQKILQSMRKELDKKEEVL